MDTLSAAPTAVRENNERRMRELGLDCLVKVLQCLVEWYEELHIGKYLTSLLNMVGNYFGH